MSALRLKRLFSGSTHRSEHSASASASQHSLEKPSSLTYPGPHEDEPDLFNPIRHHVRYEKRGDMHPVFGANFIVAWDKFTQQECTIKFIERGHAVNPQIEREILNQRRLAGHPFIVQLREVLLLPEYLAIVMDRNWSVDMEEYVVSKGNRLDEAEARALFQQVMVALAYYHDQGISGRDIKLENTLVNLQADPPVIRLCDFGYSKNEQVTSDPLSNIHILAYTAPEAITQSAGYCTQTADIWSAGVMLYMMLAGSYPFESPADRTMNDRVQKMIAKIHRVDYVQPLGVSPECVDLVSRMLVADPTYRAGIAEIFQHPWFRTAMPPRLLSINSTVQFPYDQVQSEEELQHIIHEAQVTMRRRSSKTLDELTDEVYEEGLVEQLMDEIGLGDEDDY